MERICRKLIVLLLAGTIFSSAAADGSKYVQLLQKIDYGSEVTFVISHKALIRIRSDRPLRLQNC